MIRQSYLQEHSTHLQSTVLKHNQALALCIILALLVLNIVCEFTVVPSSAQFVLMR